MASSLMSVVDHPVRRRIARLVREAERPMTALEVATQTELSSVLALFQLRKLEEVRVVTEVPLDGQAAFVDNLDALDPWVLDVVNEDA